MSKEKVKVFLKNHKYEYEISDIISLFFHRNMVEFDDEEPPFSTEELCIFSEMLYGSRLQHNNLLEHDSGFQLDSGLNENPVPRCRCLLYKDGKVMSEKVATWEDVPGSQQWENKKLEKHLVKLSAFEALQQVFHSRQPWGILTGIRPTKIVYDFMEKGMNEREISETLQKLYKVEAFKIDLISRIARIENKIISDTPPRSIGVYIGIPFCPTRCLYCSFASNPLGRFGYMVEPYLQALFKEMEAVSGMISEKGWNIQSIYIGGGTPTSLDEDFLKRVLEQVEKWFFSEKVQEYTLEAGRPDTINGMKLQTALKSGVERISINPQTMNARILENIGREHTPEQTVEAFYLAREVGFKNINMDVIAGLPGETPEEFENTLKIIRDLAPDNITVHTMAVKRSSRLHEYLQDYRLATTEIVAGMTGMAETYAREMGMHPYYLYRQKNMLGNLENVGYCKPGYESIYNIQIMEEKQTIMALGADGVSKLFFPDENRLERVFNVKSVEEYIKRIDEMIERKRGMLKEIQEEQPSS